MVFKLVLTHFSRPAYLDKYNGLYTHPAIQQLISEVLFKNKNDDAVCWIQYYSLFPTTGFALAIMTVRNYLYISTLLTQELD